MKAANFFSGFNDTMMKKIISIIRTFFIKRQKSKLKIDQSDC